jgi:hypothetical protein
MKPINTLRIAMLVLFASIHQMAFGAAVVQFRLDLADAAGNSLTSVNVGDEVYLDVYTQDLRFGETFSGVFAAYVDITYNSDVFEVNGPVMFDTLVYINGKNSDLSTPGLVNDTGAFSNGPVGGSFLSPLGNDEFYVFSVPFKAISEGNFAFETLPSESSIGFDVLVYGVNEPIRPQDIVFGGSNNRSFSSGSSSQNNVSYGSLAGQVSAVPEPTSIGLISTAFGVFCFRSLKRQRREC